MFKSHWLSFLFLLPFIVLFALHNALGLSNALMVLADDYPGRDKVFGMDVQLYNLIMVIVFLLGMSAFFLHTLYVANQDKNKNRTMIAIAKTVSLGFYWGAVLLLMQYTEGK